MTVEESLKIDTSHFTRMVPDVPAPSSPEQDLLPGRDPHLRFTAPFLPGIFPSSDTLRGFHLGGKIPQFRIPVPPQSPAQGAGSSRTTIVSSSSSSSSTTTNNPPTAQTASLTSAVINPGDQFLGTILLAKSFYLYSISVSSAVRVRLYSTIATQIVDQFRTALTSPGLGTQQGLIADINLDTAPTTWFPTPDISGSNGDVPQTNVVYITLDNIGLASTAIDISIVYVPTQS